MEQRIAAQKIAIKLADYTEARRRDVARGLETAELAGVLVQKYGYGLHDAFWEVFEDNKSAPGPTYADVDAAVASIDPDWRQTQAKRWQSNAALDLTAQRALIIGEDSDGQRE